jgi:phosphoserine phosphatase
MFHSIYQSEVIQCLLEQEQCSRKSHLGGKNQIALFDLDNTLITGNIGNAVFAQLLIDGFPLSLTWKEYQRLYNEDPGFANMEAVRTMEGITMEHIIHVSKQVLQSDHQFLICEDECVRLPKPNLFMQEIIRLLRDWRYSVFIVSSSSDISAKIAGSVLFDVPINNIAGITPMVIGKIFTRNLLEPIPVGIGKVAQYRLMSGDHMSMIVAASSELDIPLLHLCDPDGIVMIVGENQELYENAKKELSLTVHLHHIPSDPYSLLQEQHRVA